MLEPGILIRFFLSSSFFFPSRKGKIRSKSDTQTIVLKKTAKVLSCIRDWVPNRPYIVGWKLLSGVSDEELLNTARQQAQSCHINLTIANDWQKLKAAAAEGNGQHPCVAVTPDNDATPLHGTKAEVSGMIVEICLKRHALWYVTLMTHLRRFIGQTRGHCWGAPTRLQGAPRQCPLGWVASYLTYADVRTFRCLVVMMQVLAVASQQKRSTCDEERQCC